MEEIARKLMKLRLFSGEDCFGGTPVRRCPHIDFSIEPEPLHPSPATKKHTIHWIQLPAPERAEDQVRIQWMDRLLRQFAVLSELAKKVAWFPTKNEMPIANF